MAIYPQHPWSHQMLMMLLIILAAVLYG